MDIRHLIREEIRHVLLELTDEKVVKASKEKKKWETTLDGLRKKFKSTKNKTKEFMTSYIKDYKEAQEKFDKANSEYMDALKNFEKYLMGVGYSEVS